MIEVFKSAIRPGLAIWAATILTLSFILQLPLEVWVRFIAIACIAEWFTERGIKRARDILR